MIARYLDPADAYAEILFGLIMALTFTLGATLVIPADAATHREIAVGAVACNVAWGVIDGFFYILGELYELGRKGLQIAHVKAASTTQEAIRRVGEVLDEKIDAPMTSEERERLAGMIHQLVGRMEAPRRRPTREGIIGALIVFALVSATGLPALLPVLLLTDDALALRIANGLLILCLFLTGCGMARTAGGRPLRFGLIVATIGLVLVLIAKALGG